MILIGAVVSHSISTLIFISLYANNTKESTTPVLSPSITNSTEKTIELGNSFNDNMKCLFLMLFAPEVHRFIRNDFIIHQVDSLSLVSELNGLNNQVQSDWYLVKVVKSCLYFMILRGMTQWRWKPVILLSYVEFIDALNLGKVFSLD